VLVVVLIVAGLALHQHTLAPLLGLGLPVRVRDERERHRHRRPPTTNWSAPGSSCVWIIHPSRGTLGAPAARYDGGPEEGSAAEITGARGSDEHRSTVTPVGGARP
jgi:hypothetical protein